MPIQRNYLVKVYGQDGTTLKGIVATDLPLSGTSMYLKNTPQFRTRINGGQGECVLDLKTKFDSFSEGTLVNFLNIVRIYSVVVNQDVSPKTQTQTLIYTGFMSRYEAYLDNGGDEGVRVTCLGLVSLLTRSYYGGFGTTTETTKDPETIGKDIIDHFNTIFGGSLIGYSGTTQTVGTSVTYAFTDQKWFDALVTAGKLAGTNWWWAIREDGNYYLKAKPGSATHRLVIAEHISAIQGTKDSEKVINDIQVRRSGGTATNYTDATSQGTYGTGGTPSGKYSEIISDTNITDATTANQRGQKELNDLKDYKLSAVVTVATKNYNIESIHVGDTVSIFNYAKASTFFPSNMLVASTDYKGDTVDLELERIDSDFGTALNRFVYPATST